MSEATTYISEVSDANFLVTVSGPDRVGVGAELFAAVASLAAHQVTVRDVAQITIRGYLVLCCDVTAPASLSCREIEDALAARDIARDGIHATVSQSTEESEESGRRLLVTILATQIRANQLDALFRTFAQFGATCERILHLASYPVDCYELVVRGVDQDSVRSALTEVAGRVGLDIAIQRAGLHRRSKHLVVMDADSTLLQDEVIDLLADECNCAEEVSKITESAMAGEIDFAESLRRRVALLEGLPESTLDAVRERLVLTPGARTLLRTLQRLGYETAVVSGGFVEILQPLTDELGVRYLAANQLEVIDGRLTGRVIGEIVDRAGKARALEAFAAAVGVPLEQTVAVGDGANDIDMLGVAGLGIAFNAKAIVKEHADAALSVPYLDAVLYFLGITREEIESN